jgi:hypothetical protein
MIEKLPVRRVSYDETPELKPLAEHARQIGNEVYPKLAALLNGDVAAAPEQFDIVFKRRLPGNNQGSTIGATIYLNAGYWKTNDSNVASRFEQVLIHEMGHVAQNYGGSKQDWSNMPWWWAEGLADYARYKLGYTNGPACPECSAEYAHYTYGYRCAGALLLYLDATYGSRVVQRLHRELQRRSYSDELFVEATDRTLDELWLEFQKTAAYKPGATELYKLHTMLGYVNGKPPADIGTRRLAWLKDRPGGPLTLDAASFLKGLAEQHQLPGLLKVRKKWRKPKISFAIGLELDDLVKAAETSGYPASRRFYGQRSDDPLKIFYVVERASEDSPWRLQKAWRVAADGDVLEEYRLE